MTLIKKIIKKVITFLLKTEARLILRKYKPKIVAVTGTVGKTSAKDAIALVLSTHLSIRKNEKSYNSEFGVPLTIIGEKSGWNNPLHWVVILFKGLKVLFSDIDYPEWLVLEMGVDRPGDMKNLVSWVKPDVGVITHVGETPVHVEYFKSPVALAQEKAKLIRVLDEGKYAIFNGDDVAMLDFKSKTKAKILTYGFLEENHLRATNYTISPDGITFKAEFRGNIVPVRLHNLFGRHHVYTVLAALAVTISQGLNFIEMAEHLSRFKSPPGRLNLLDGIKKTFILDDTYNSSPAAMEAAFEALRDLPARRKIAVLGDMLELGKFTIYEHKKAGRLAKESKVNYLFTVGPRAKFMAEEARDLGFDPKHIYEFSTADEAKLAVQKKMKEGDLILIKGSQSMRMEKIVEEIMAHPEQKEELLVRQSKEWLKR